jgi:hypothetical protein
MKWSGATITTFLIEKSKLDDELGTVVPRKTVYTI